MRRNRFVMAGVRACITGLAPALVGAGSVAMSMFTDVAAVQMNHVTYSGGWPPPARILIAALSSRGRPSVDVGVRTVRQEAGDTLI